MPDPRDPKALNQAARVVAANVAKLRKIAGLSQQQMAERVGVTCQQMHKYEYGINRIPAGRLPAMAEALGVDIRDLFETLPDAPESDGRMLDLTSAALAMDPKTREAFCRMVAAIAYEQRPDVNHGIAHEQTEFTGGPDA